MPNDQPNLPKPDRSLLHALLFSPVVSAVLAGLAAAVVSTYFVGQYSAAESRAKEGVALREQVALEIDNRFRPERARLENEAKRIENQIKEVEKMFAVERNALAIRESDLRAEEKELGNRVKGVEASVASLRTELELTRTKGGITGDLTELLAALQPNATLATEARAGLCGGAPRISLLTTVTNHGRFAVTVGRPTLLLSTQPFTDVESASQENSGLLRPGIDYKHLGSNLIPGYLQAGRSVGHSVSVELARPRVPGHIHYFVRYGLASNKDIIAIAETYLRDALKGSSVDLASAGRARQANHGLLLFPTGDESLCAQPT